MNLSSLFSKPLSKVTCDNILKDAKTLGNLDKLELNVRNDNHISEKQCDLEIKIPCNEIKVISSEIKTSNKSIKNTRTHKKNCKKNKRKKLLKDYIDYDKIEESKMGLNWPNTYFTDSSISKNLVREILQANDHRKLICYDDWDQIESSIPSTETNVKLNISSQKSPKKLVNIALQNTVVYDAAYEPINETLFDTKIANNLNISNTKVSVGIKLVEVENKIQNSVVNSKNLSFTLIDNNNSNDLSPNLYDGCQNFQRNIKNLKNNVPINNIISKDDISKSIYIKDSDDNLLINNKIKQRKRKINSKMTKTNNLDNASQINLSNDENFLNENEIKKIFCGDVIEKETIEILDSNKLINNLSMGHKKVFLEIQTNTKKTKTNALNMNKKDVDCSKSQLVNSFSFIDPTIAAVEQDIKSDKGNNNKNKTGKKKKKSLAKLRAYYDRMQKQREREKERGKITQSKIGTVVCKYYSKLGSCNKGDECTYKHEIIKIEEPCKYYMVNSCSKFNNCQYYHRDWPCKFFHFFKFCGMGDNCRFSHEPQTSITLPLFEKIKQEIQLQNENKMEKFSEVLQPDISERNVKQSLNVDSSDCKIMPEMNLSNSDIANQNLSSPDYIEKDNKINNLNKGLLNFYRSTDENGNQETSKRLNPDLLNNFINSSNLCARNDDAQLKFNNSSGNNCLHNNENIMVDKGNCKKIKNDVKIDYKHNLDYAPKKYIKLYKLRIIDFSPGDINSKKFFNTYNSESDSLDPRLPLNKIKHFDKPLELRTYPIIVDWNMNI